MTNNPNAKRFIDTPLKVGFHLILSGFFRQRWNLLFLLSNLHILDTSMGRGDLSLPKKSELSRFGGLSFFHNIELLRREYSQEVFTQYPSLEKNNNLFYLSPYTYYESSHLYMSSYETICELARYCFCFNEVYTTSTSVIRIDGD